ncbi:MAG TPA: ComEC/Rec2 family competence protein [Solirubrobacterales bacterium]
MLLLTAVATVAVLALLHTVEIRGRAEAALGRGMPAREAELARGFVLGQDERIDPRTVEDFRRSGLSHLLAVSGQNVALLALLAMPVLAALGIPLRARLIWILALIAVYVPLAGSGPSIQRAGVMGALSVLATLGGRRSSLLHTLLIAAIVTVAIDPGVAADVGWQLSFAAVTGIIALAGSLRAAIAAWIGRGSWRSTLADGAAMTTAATLATAPLIAFHFGAVSTTTLLANLAAMPAVAPAMWLGMLAAAGGQVPGFPVEAINAINAPLLAYIAQIAAWCGRPGWAYLELRLGGAGLVVSYLALAVAVLLTVRWRRSARIGALRRRAAGGPKTHAYRGRSARRRWYRRSAPGLALALLAVALAGAGLGGGAGATGSPVRGLRVSVLDVGQGDAILLQPRRAPAVLVDAGPPGAGLAERLHRAGVERLGAALITHDQADHAGGLAELLTWFPIGQVLFGELGKESRDLARASGVALRRISAGGELRSGGLRLTVLWPPREVLHGSRAGVDPNDLSLVALARWRDFTMLLGADAEAEAVPLDPGPIDVLKVAHHGSDDAGLESLLSSTGPQLAVISVGEGNPFGHPTPRTLATLASHGVQALRTDRDGTVTLSAGRGGVSVSVEDR